MKRRVLSLVMAAAMTFTSLPLDNLNVWASEPVQEMAVEETALEEAVSEEIASVGDAIEEASLFEDVFEQESDQPLENPAEEGLSLEELPAEELIDDEQPDEESPELVSADEFFQEEADTDAPEEEEAQTADSSAEEVEADSSDNEAAVDSSEEETAKEKEEDFQDADGEDEASIAEEAEEVLDPAAEAVDEDAEEILTEESAQAAVEAGANASTDAEIIQEATANPLTVNGDPVNVTFTSDKWIYFYSFTPETTAYYTIESRLTSGSYDTCVWLYQLEDGTLESITSNDDGGDGNQFKLEYQLEAEVTYIYKISHYNESAPSGSPAISVSFSTPLQLSGISALTNEIDTFSAPSYSEEFRLSLDYEDGTRTGTVTTDYRTYDDGKYRLQARGLYDEYIYVAFYDQDDNEVNAPDTYGLLSEAEYQVEPYIYNDEDEKVTFGKTALKVTTPEFTDLTAGAAETLTLNEGEAAYYRISADGDLQVNLWMEEEDSNGLSVVEFMGTEGNLSSNNTTLYAGQANSKPYKLTAGQLVYLRLYNNQSSTREILLHLDEILTAQALKVKVSESYPITRQSMDYYAYQNMFQVDVTWSNGTTEELTDWESTYDYVGTGEARKYVRILYAASKTGGETIGLVFKEDGSYVNYMVPSNGLPLEKRYTLLPFVYDDPENAEKFAADGAIQFSYVLNGAITLQQGEEGTVDAEAEEYAWAEFTAPAEGTYYAQSKYITEEYSGNTSIYVYKKNSNGVYSSSTSGNMPTFQLAEGEKVVLRMGYQYQQAAYSVTVARKYPLSEVKLYDAQGSVFDVADNSSYYLRKQLRLDLIYGTAEAGETRTLDLSNNGYRTSRRVEGADGEEAKYIDCFQLNGPYNETVYIDFFSQGAQVDMPAYDYSAGTPAAADYKIKATVSYRDENYTSQTLVSNEADYALTDPTFEELNVGETKDYTLVPGQYSYYKIQAPADGNILASLWQQTKSGSYSYIRLTVYNKTAEGRYTSSGNYNSSMSSGANYGTTVRVPKGDTLYVRLRHPSSSENPEEAPITGTLHLDGLRQAKAIELVPSDNPVPLDRKVISNSSREWLTAKVTWNDNTTTTISRWSNVNRSVGSGEASTNVRVLRANNSGSSDEQIAVAFKDETGKYVNAPSYSDALPLGKTYELVPFIYDLPDKVDEWKDSAEKVTFRLSDDAADNLVLDEKTEVFAAANDYYVAVFTAQEDSEYYVTGADRNGNSLNISIYTANASDAGMYNSIKSGNKPSFFLKNGEKALIVARNNTSSRTKANLTVSKKYPLKNIVLSDGDASVFALYTYDVSSSSNLIQNLQMNFIYGEGEQQTTETIKLTGGGNSYGTIDETWVRYYYAYGPYGEYVQLVFKDTDGKPVDAPAMEDNKLPAPGRYPVEASVSYTDQSAEEPKEETFTSQAAVNLYEPDDFTELSLRRTKNFVAAYRELDFFSYTADEDGSYAVSLAESNIGYLRLSRFKKEGGQFTYIDDDELNINSGNRQTFDMKAGETVYFALRNTSYSTTGRGSLKLTNLQDIQSVSLAVDEDKIFTINTLEGYSEFLSAAYTTEGGKTGTITSWNRRWVQFGEEGFEVLCGSGPDTEEIGVVFKYQNAYVDYPFEDGIYGDSDYTMQPFRMKHVDEISEFASQNPGTDLSLKLSQAAAELEVEEKISFAEAEETEKLYKLTIPEDGRYYATTGGYREAYLRIYKKSSGKEGAGDRTWYDYDRGFWNANAFNLKKDDELIIAVNWEEEADDEDYDADDNCELLVTKSKKITAVTVQDRTVTIPSYHSSYQEFEVEIRYEGEDSAYKPESLWVDSDSCLKGYGRYNEPLYVYFYDVQTGKRLTTLPDMGWEHWDDWADTYTCTYKEGTWNYDAVTSWYDPEKKTDVEVASEKKTYTQTSAQFTDLQAGEVKNFSLQKDQDGFFRMIADEKAAYEFWISEASDYELPGRKFTYDPEAKTYTYAEDDYIYLYNNEEGESDNSYTEKLDEGASLYLVVNNDYYDRMFSGKLHFDKGSALEEKELEHAIPLKDGYRSALSLEADKTLYYSFEPEEGKEGCEPGEYLFLDDFAGNPTIELYSKYGSSWIREESAYTYEDEDEYDEYGRSYKGRKYIRFVFEAGTEYIISVNEGSTRTSSNYIYFGKPSMAAEYAVKNMPAEMSLLSVPQQMANVSVSLKTADGSTEEITQWQSAWINKEYDGMNLYSNYDNAVLSGQSALTGQTLYLAAISDSGKLGYLATDYSNYTYGRFGEYTFHVLAVSQDNSNVLVDLITPQALTIKAPSQDEIPVISADTGERTVELASGQARVYRLDVSTGTTYRLQGKDNVYTQSLMYRVNEKSTSSDYQMNRYNYTTRNYSWSFSVNSNYEAGTYLVVYAPTADQTQHVELTTSTAYALKSAALKANWKIPTFVEGLYWESGYWDIAEKEGIDAVFTYEDETLGTASYTYADGTRSWTDDHGTSRMLYAFKESSTGILERAATSFGSRLDPGTYYAAIRNSANSSLPEPAPGKTITTKPLAGDISAVEFEVISREDAVKGHDFISGKASLTSDQGYFAGAAYTAAADAKVKFTSSKPVSDFAIFEAGSSSSLGYDNMDAYSYVVSLEKGKSYQVFVQPDEEGDFTLSCESMKVITEAILSSHLSEKEIGTDETIGVNDFTVHAVYEDGTDTFFQGREEDVYTNWFTYQYRETGTDAAEDAEWYSLKGSYPVGTYEVRAKVDGYDLFSTNTVRFTVKDAAQNAQETILVDEIKEVAAGTAKDFIFEPEKDGLYSILLNGDLYGSEFRRVTSSGNYYVEQAAEGVSRLAAGKKYLVRTYTTDKVQYVSVTRKTPVELTEDGLTSSLVATGNHNGYLLLQAKTDGSFKLEMTPSGFTGNRTWYTYVDLNPSAGNGYDSTYLSSDAATITRYFEVVNGGLYQVRMSDGGDGITGYEVKLSPNPVKLASWTLLAKESTDLPVMLSGYFARYVAKVQETFSDETTEVIATGTTGKYGDRFSYSTSYDYSGDMTLSVYRAGGNDETQRRQVKMRTDYSVYPLIEEGKAASNGLNAENAYLYRFVPSKDSVYTISVSSNIRYNTYLYSTGESSVNRLGSKLVKGDTYLVCIVPVNGQAAASAPTVTVSERTTLEVKDFAITKGPNVVLHQETDLAGMTITVTYTNNSTAVLTYNYEYARDQYGNYFYADRALLPDNGTDVTYRYRAYSQKLQHTIDVKLTDPSTLPAIAQTEAAAKSGAAVISGDSVSRWFAFTPSSSGTYNMIGTYENTGNVEASSYAASVYPSDSGMRLYSPYNLEAGKTYVIRHSASGAAGAKLGLYVTKSVPAAVTRYAQQVNYIFAKAAGTIRDLPAQVTDLKPENKTVLQNDEPDLETPEKYSIVEEKSGETVVGCWTFEGYDVETLLATNQNDKASVTVTGTWSFAEATQKVTYEFASDDHTKTLPEELVNTLLPAEEEWGRGRTITPTAPAKTSFETIRGNWTFKGYGQTSVTIGTADVKLTGSWTYTDETHKISYSFVSGTDGKTLPADVTKLVPADQTGLVKGSRVAPVLPAQTEVEDTAGRWIFTGYDVSDAVTIRSEDIQVTGTWTYITEVHVVNYVFVNADGGSVDKEVLEYLPTPSQLKDVPKGTSVKAAEPSSKKVTTEHGEWIFVGYDKSEFTVGNDDVTITGTWTYADDEYTVKYEFVADVEGKEIPAEVKAVLPGAHKEVRGTEVTPKKPIRTSVVVGAESWNFLGYQPESVTIGSKDVTFTGTWTSEEVHTVKYKFVSDTKDMDFADDDEDGSLQESLDALLPGDANKHEETWKKGETKTLTPAAGVTAASRTGVWTFKGYTKNYTKYAEHTYISELTMESEDVTLTGVWTFDETKVQISYRYVDEKGAEITDASVKALLPEAKTYVKGDICVPVEPETKEIDGEHGVWTFIGNDPKASFRVEDQSVVITGTWKYAEVQTNVLYQFQSVTDDKITEEVITKGGKPADTKVRMGDPLTLPSLAVTTVPDETGNWTFKGWHLLGSTEYITSVNVGKTTVTIIGDWEYKPEEHDVKYAFKVSAASDKNTLPSEIAVDLLPETQLKVRKSRIVTPTMPKKTTVEDENGNWTFDGYEGYDEANPPKMGTSDITFTGTWTHKNETHLLKYKYTYTKSGNVTDEVFTAAQTELNEKTADLKKDQTLTKGDAITLAAFAAVETTHGNWTFDGFVETVPEKMDKDDITLTAKWIYANEIHEVLYADYLFEYEDGTSAKAADAVQLLKPKNTEAIKGSLVEPAKPSQVEIEVDGATWHFRGYDPANTTMGKDNITFTGTWSQCKSYQVTYVFASEDGSELPEAVKTLLTLVPTQTDFENEKVQLQTLPADKQKVAVEHGNWTFKGFDKSGEIVLIDNVIVTGTWNYADEQHTVSYAPASATDGKTIPAEVTAVMPAAATVVKGNQTVLAAPSKELVDSTDGHWKFEGYTVNGTDVTPEQVKADGGYPVNIGTADVAVAAKWSFEEHPYGGWARVKDPTTAAEGRDERVCPVCGHVDGRSVAKLVPANPEGDASNPTSVAGQEKAITAISNDGDPAGSSFAKIQAKSTKQTNTSVTISWNKVPGAAGYIIYGNKCGRTNKFLRIQKIENGSTTNFTYYGLKKGTYYKIIVVAYGKADGTETVLCSSKAIHVITKGHKKYTNIKKLTLNKKSVSLKKKKSFTVKVKKTTLQAKKLKNKNHRKTMYESSNTKVATVSKSGKIKGVGKGTCYVYVYAQNGVFAKIKVTVK